MQISLRWMSINVNEKAVGECNLRMDNLDNGLNNIDNHAKEHCLCVKLRLRWIKVVKISFTSANFSPEIRVDLELNSNILHVI